MLNSPITRLGGKMRLRKKIIGILPNHTCYVEPFFGAGWVFFGKEHSRCEVINDVDGELMNMYRCLKFHSEELSRYIDHELWSRESFANHLKSNLSSLTDIQRAARYYCLMHLSFGGQGKTFGYSAVSGPKIKFFDSSFFKEIRDRLKNCFVESLSYDLIIEKYDRPGTLFFLDPPYFETSMSFGPDHVVIFGEDEYIHLAKCLSSLKGKFILTVGDHPLMWHLFSQYSIEPVTVGYSVSRTADSRKKYEELIIKNF